MLSIIIPHNHKLSHLKKCLMSITKQTYLPKLETIIIFDKIIHSQKRIEKYLLLKFKLIGIKVIFNSKSIGVSASRNNGLKLSSFNYVAFQDSDDEWLPEKLEIQLKYMLNKKIQFTHSSYLRRELNQKDVKIASGFRKYNKFNVFMSCKIATPTVIFNKLFFNEPLFDEKLNFMEDLDFWIQCSKKSNLFGINKTLVIVIVHKNSSFRKKEYFYKSYLYLTNKYIESFLLRLIYKIFWNTKLLIKDVIS